MLRGGSGLLGGAQVSRAPTQEGEVHGLQLGGAGVTMPLGVAAEAAPL